MKSWPARAGGVRGHQAALGLGAADVSDADLAPGLAAAHPGRPRGAHGTGRAGRPSKIDGGTAPVRVAGQLTQLWVAVAEQAAWEAG